MSNSSEEMLSKAEKLYSKVLRTIKEGIDETFSFKEPLSSAANHYFLAGGKGLRPALTVFSCEATGGLEEEAIHTAAAIETLHTFTLVHDDIMDNDDLRRNLPTVHKKWNVDTAILTGDAQLSLAFWLLTQAKISNEISTHLTYIQLMFPIFCLFYFPFYPLFFSDFVVFSQFFNSFFQFYLFFLGLFNFEFALD